VWPSPEAELADGEPINVYPELHIVTESLSKNDPNAVPVVHDAEFGGHA